MKDVIIFDYDYYYEHHRDVLRAGVDGLDHFVRHGRFEGRTFRSDIDLRQAIESFLEDHETYSKDVFLDHVIDRISQLRDSSSEDARIRRELDKLASSSARANGSVAEITMQMSPAVNMYRFEKSTTDRPRINMVVPTLNDSAIYGGIKTAIDFFLWLVDDASDGVDFRIISQNDAQYGEIVNRDFAGRGFRVSGPDAEGARLVVSGQHRDRVQLPLRKDDFFITTFWATAFCVQQGLDAARSGARICHFLQDYEPNFYPANSLQQLCLSSLRHERNALYITNSIHLAQFIDGACDLPAPCIPFTPRINPSLKPGVSRKRSDIVLFYARKNPRNLFEIGRISLAMFHEMHPQLARQFQFIGIGDISGSYRIGDDSVLHCIGKLTLEQYRTWMGRARVGLSLMMAPHPSYPPLEMAYNGLRVVTNNFATKNMSEVHPNIVAAESPEPELICNLLYAQCMASRAGEPVVAHPFGAQLEGFESADAPFSGLWSSEEFRAIFGRFRKEV